MLRWRIVSKKAVLISVVLVALLVFSSTLARAQWVSVDAPAIGNDAYLFGVHFPSPDKGWAVGWDRSDNEDKGILLQYENGQWASIHLSHPPLNGGWLLTGAHFTSENEGWVVGQQKFTFAGLLLHYSNGTWSYDSTLPAFSDDWWLWKVHFTSPDEGWAVGGNGHESTGVLLHYSKFGGAQPRWDYVVPPNLGDVMWTLLGVHFTSKDEGWAVGRIMYSQNNPGVLLHYLDGHWVSVTPPEVSNLWDLWAVHFPSPDLGWAVGTDYVNGRGVLLRYQKCQFSPCQTEWESILPPPNVSKLHGVHFTSEDEGWAVGVDNTNGRGVLLHYMEGAWTSVEPPSISTNWDLWDVHFTSTNEGWAAGRDGVTGTGVLLHYKAVEVASPSGGEKWQKGKTHTIRWRYSGDLGSSVRIELLKGRTLNATLATGVPIGTGGEGSYDWSIPTQQIAGTDYRIRVAVEGNEAYADTGVGFSIIKTPEKAGILVKDPNGGETWYAGATQTIRWSFMGNTGPDVKIELLDSKGKTVNIIAASVPIGKAGFLEGQGSYKWTIPTTQNPGQYTVRITSTTKKSIKDTSDGKFTIHAPFIPPTITVTSPNGGESWQAGTTHTIQWSYTGDPGSNVKIEAYRTTGTALAYYPVVASTPIGSSGTGSYAWAIPSGQPAGSDYKIVVKSTVTSSYTDISDNYFSITAGASTPTITVASPNGGESWQVGTTHTIQWSYTGDPGSNVKIEAYRTTGTALAYYPVVASTPIGSSGTGSYAWAIPSGQPVGSDYKIVVTSTTSSSYTDISDNYFSITAGASTPTITVTSANGGETMQAGWTGYMNPNIQWKYTGDPGANVKIELLKGGALNHVIAASVPIGSGGSGSYYWDIPVSQVAGTDYRIRITSTSNASYTDTSNGDFTIIAAPTITLTAPNGGESWQPGSTYTITWTYGGSLFSPPFNSIKIELLKGGVLNSTIASDVSVGSGGSGSYSWTIPGGQSPGADYRVRLTYRFYNQISDTSNANFTIEPCFSPVSITVVSPNGGETWLRGTAHTIQWSYVGCPGPNVKIELLKAVPGAGPPIYETTLIVASTPIGSGGSGSYSWTIPSSPAPGLFYKIKITALPGGTLSDQSNNLFSITAIY